MGSSLRFWSLTLMALILPSELEVKPLLSVESCAHLRSPSRQAKLCTVKRVEEGVDESWLPFFVFLLLTLGRLVGFGFRVRVRFRLGAPLACPDRC